MLKKKLGPEAIERNWDWRKSKRLVDYFKIPTSLIISESVKKIGRFAFNSCKVKRVVVKRIGDYAFVRCLNAIIILKKHKKDFEKIEERAFNGCRNVKEEVGN